MGDQISGWSPKSILGKKVRSYEWWSDLKITWLPGTSLQVRGGKERKQWFKSAHFFHKTRMYESCLPLKNVFVRRSTCSEKPLTSTAFVFPFSMYFHNRSALKTILNQEYTIRVIRNKRWFNFLSLRLTTELVQTLLWPKTKHLDVIRTSVLMFLLDQNIFSCLRILQNKCVAFESWDGDTMLCIYSSFETELYLKNNWNCYKHLWIKHKYFTKRAFITSWFIAICTCACVYRHILLLKISNASTFSRNTQILHKAI